MSLAIVMPAYNEAACIGSVVRAWLAVLDSIDGFLLVVNDGSPDRTGEILDRMAEKEPRLVVCHKANGGHGAAVIYGYRAALDRGCDYVFQTDSDDQFEPQDFWKLWAERAQSPLVLGRRKNRQDPLARLFISRALALGIRLIFRTQLSDANVPFRLYRAGFLRLLLEKLPVGVFAPNIFLSILACRDLGNVPYIEVTHKARHTGKVSIFGWKLFKICLRCVRELTELRGALWRSTLLAAQPRTEKV